MDRALFGSAMSGSDDTPHDDPPCMLDLYCRRLDELCPMGGTGRNDALQHAAWMCGEARRFLE